MKQRLMTGSIFLLVTLGLAAEPGPTPPATGFRFTYMSKAAGEVKWRVDYDAAVAEAKRSKKLLMVDVYTDWCGYCKKLDKDVYANRDVADRINREFVPLKLNPDKGARNKSISRKFGVHGYPTTLFLDGEGNLVSQFSGYVSVNEFLRELDEALAKQK